MTKILIIEDEKNIRHNITELLKAEGYDVFCTDNGIIGTLWAQEKNPDLIICDIMMPEIDGYEVLKELRNLPGTELTPFIFLTAMADKSDIRHGMELGADDYLTKPFTLEEILGAIESRLARQKITMQQYNSEQRRAEALQKKVNALEESRQQRAEALQRKVDILQEYANKQAQLEAQLEENLPQEQQKALLKLNRAISLLKKVPINKIKEHRKILQEICAEEIELFKKYPDLQNLIPLENNDLLNMLISL